MKLPSSFILTALVLSFAVTAQAQSSGSNYANTRPRLVANAKTARAKQEPTNQRPAQPRVADNDNPQSPDDVRANARDDRRPSPTRLRLRITEAERLWNARPVPTAMTRLLEYVTLAALLPETSQIHLIRISKETFLSKGSEVSAISTLGLPVQIRIVRANGVNTAVTIFDNKNRALMPLVVEYPIERKGLFREMAYYTSAHPALLSPELMKSGQTYVNSMIDLAAKRLRERGNFFFSSRRRHTRFDCDWSSDVCSSD